MNLNDLFSNKILIVSLISSLIAQTLKFVYYSLKLRKFDRSRLFDSGGMPSAHSATVCSLAVVVARFEGLGSAAFAISLIFAIIVMYDAMGVRRAVGDQAKVINLFLENHNNDESTNKFLDKNLKEILGHTPVEVLVGAILGVLIGAFYPL